MDSAPCHVTRGAIVMFASPAVALWMTIACLGCASTTPAPDTTISEHTISTPGNLVLDVTDVTTAGVVRIKGSVADALRALAQVYDDLQIPVTTLIPQAGQIGNQRMRVTTRRLAGQPVSVYLDCGQESVVGSRADLDDVTLSVLSTARANGDSVSRVSTIVSGSARPATTSADAVECQTTGVLEKAVATRLRARVGELGGT